MIALNTIDHWINWEVKVLSTKKTNRLKLLIKTLNENILENIYNFIVNPKFRRIKFMVGNETENLLNRPRVVGIESIVVHLIVRWRLRRQRLLKDFCRSRLRRWSLQIRSTRTLHHQACCLWYTQLFSSLIERFHSWPTDRHDTRKELFDHPANEWSNCRCLSPRS